MFGLFLSEGEEKVHQYKGKLVIHTGSMFSGKTSSLENDIKRFCIAGYKTIAFKPVVDTRYGGSEIKTHDNTVTKAVLTQDINHIRDYSKQENADVIAIDEVQFLGGGVDEIIEGINHFLENGITVIVAGLDMDFEGRPFEIMKELMPISDYLYKHHAVCVSCGTDAWVSHRKVSAKERLVLGASKEYEPLCRSCYIREKKKEELLVNKNQVKFDLDKK